MKAEKKIALIQLFRNNLKMFADKIDKNSNTDNIQILSEEEGRKKIKEAKYYPLEHIDDKNINKEDKSNETPTIPPGSVTKNQDQNNTESKKQEEQNKLDENNKTQTESELGNKTEHQNLNNNNIESKKGTEDPKLKVRSNELIDNSKNPKYYNQNLYKNVYNQEGYSPEEQKERILNNQLGYIKNIKGVEDLPTKEKLEEGISEILNNKNLSSKEQTQEIKKITQGFLKANSTSNANLNSTSNVTANDTNGDPTNNSIIDYSVLSALSNAKPRPYDLKFEEAKTKLLEKYGDNKKATNAINKLATKLINEKPDATGNNLLDAFNKYQQNRTNVNTKIKGYQVNEIGDLVQTELDGVKHDINTGKNTSSNNQPQSQPSTISIPGDPNIVPSAGVPQGYIVQEYDESSGQWIFTKQDSNSSDNSSSNKTSSDSDNKGALNVRIKTVRNEDGTFTTTFYNPKTNMISEYIGTVDENGQIKNNEFKSSVHVLDTKYKDSDTVARADEDYQQYKADQEAINNTPENLQKQGQYAANRANKSQEGFRIINDDSFKTWQKEQSKKLKEYKKQVGLRRTSAAVGAVVGALLNHKRRMDKWRAQAQWAIYNHKPIPRQPSILLSYLGGGLSGATAGFVGGSILKTTGLGKTLDSAVKRLGLENSVKGNEDEYKELNKNTNVVRDAYYKQANDKARELIKNIISNTPENKSTRTRNIKNSQDRDYLLSALETDAGKQYVAGLLGIKGSTPSASELWYRLTGSYNVPNWYRNSNGKIKRFEEGRSRKEFFFSKSSISEDTLELYNISYYLYRCFSNIETGVEKHSDKFENILALYSAVNSLPKYQNLDLVLFSEEYLIHGKSYKNFLEKELSTRYLDLSETYEIPKYIDKFYTNYSEAFPYGMPKSEFVSKVLFNDCFKPYILDKIKYKSLINRANNLVLFNDFDKKKPDSVILSDDSIDDIKIQQNNGQEDKQTATNLTQQDLDSQKQTITQNQNQLDKQKKQQEKLNEVKNLTNNNINDIQDNAKIKEQEIKDKLNNIIKEINAANIQGDEEKAGKLKDKLQNFRLKIQDIKNNRENKVQEQKDRYENEKQKLDNNKINGVQNFSNINKEKAQEIALNYFKAVVYTDLMEFNKKGRDGKFKILQTLKLTDKDLSMFSKWKDDLKINTYNYSGSDIQVIIKNKYMNKDYNNTVEQFNVILDKDYNIKYSYCSVDEY